MRPHESTSLVSRQSASMMVEAYQTAVNEIVGAYGVLAVARDRLKTAFAEGYGFNVTERYDPEHVQKECLLSIKQAAWRAIVEKVQLRQVMCSAKAKELDEWLKKANELPEITLDAVLGMCTHTRENLDEYLNDAIKEVFNWLRPRQVTYGKNYKTNKEFEIGPRVIKTGIVTCVWRETFDVNYREQELRNLDNVFSLLDGCGPIKSHYGPLLDAIKATPKKHPYGATAYFQFRCCKNGNLHLEFRRLDLLAKLNQIGGGNMLKKDQEAA